MQQLQATAKLYELVELPHLHLSRTFTYYRLPYFWILSNYTSLTSPLFCLNILLPDTPSPPWGFHTVDLGGVTGVELLPNLRTWRLHYLTAPGTLGVVHTHSQCALFYIWLSTLPGQRFVHIIGKMCRRVPISGPFSHIPFSVCTKFSHIVPHIQSVGTVSMEGNCDWGQFSFAWSSNWSRPRNNLSHRPIVRLSSRAIQLEGRNCLKMGLKMTSCPDEKAQQHLTQWVVTSALAPARHMSRSVST